MCFLQDFPSNRGPLNEDDFGYSDEEDSDGDSVQSIYSDEDEDDDEDGFDGALLQAALLSSLPG